MKHLRKFISAVLCVLILCSFTTTAFATEVQNAPVTIVITDLTEGFNGTVKVDFYNTKNSELVKTIELTKGNCWGNDTGYKFEIPTQYTYSIMFSGLDGMEVIDTFSLSPISAFQPQPLTNDLYWSLVKKEEPVATESNNTATSATGTDRNNITVQNQEAEEVYQKFLEKISFIEHDESWYNGVSGLLQQYNETTDSGKPAINAKTYSTYYVNAVQGATAEQFFELSKYERFLWTETYTRFVAKMKENREGNFANEASFRKNVMNIPIQLMNGNNKETVIAAYEELAMWQYEYIKENGYPFNFISNRSYVDEIDTSSQTLPSTDPTESSKSETEEIQEVIDNELTPEEKEEVQKEKTIWTDTLDILADNALTILAIIALGIGVAVVYFIKSRKNIDDK